MSTAIERQGNTLTVRPEGPLDTVRTPVLENELQPQLDGIEHIIMDFNGVKYIASSGLRLLLVLENQMEERGGEGLQPGGLPGGRPGYSRLICPGKKPRRHSGDRTGALPGRKERGAMDGQKELVYESIIRDISEGIMTIDVNGVIKTFNPAAEQILNRKREAVTGRPFARIFLAD